MWWGIAFLYMTFMLAIHSKSKKVIKEKWKLYLRYILVYLSSVYALMHSERWGIIYMALACFIVTTNMFEVRR
jgi:hypothetical protein